MKHAPLAEEIASMHGWTILRTYEHEERVDLIAVNEVTGEAKDLDLSSHTALSLADVERVVLMGFPDRGDKRGPLTHWLIAALWCDFKTDHPDIAYRAILSGSGAFDRHMREGRFARLWA